MFHASLQSVRTIANASLPLAALGAVGLALSPANAQIAELILPEAPAPVPAPELADPAPVEAAALPTAAKPLDRATECIAKVIAHEAANQPRKGQLAVAQLILARAKSGRFPATPCAVVNQRGQFFDTDRYHPSRTTPIWHSAVAVARDALDGESPQAVPGALFYHAAYAGRPTFFRTRQQVGVLGDHVFYR